MKVYLNILYRRNQLEKIINNLISQKKVWKTFLMKKK